MALILAYNQNIKRATEKLLTTVSNLPKYCGKSQQTQTHTHTHICNI